jgi:osmotically-inducible protein OsmY
VNIDNRELEALTMARATTIGTRRDDTELFGAARTALDRQPGIPATIHVHVENGIATLTGTARLPSERTAAVKVIRGVHGIVQVVNKIVVAQDTTLQDVESS